MTNTIFDAASNGDCNLLKAFVDGGADLNAYDKHGFTALHRSAMSADTLNDLSKVLACLQYLVDAGSDIERKSKDGRTALYLAAEFSESIQPVELLIAAGANPDVRGVHNVHVVVNAWNDDAKKLLSKLSGFPIPAPQPPEPKSVRIKAVEWRELQPLLDKAFDLMTRSGLVALQDVGTTQSDAFDDCSEIFRERTAAQSQPLGFCFYTRQDLDRAKKTGKLSLGIWGAPDGSPTQIATVAEIAIDAFQSSGLPVRWDSDPSERPMVLLAQQRA